MNAKSFVVIAFVGTGIILARLVFAQTDKPLGKAYIDTSCNPETQELFNRTILYQCSFWYRASQKTFEQVLKKDPECGFAYGGIALSLRGNQHVLPPGKNLADGAAVLTKERSVGAKTQRKRDCMDAHWLMYGDYDKIDHRTRNQAYAKPMKQLAQRFSEDEESQIRYAFVLNTLALPSENACANQRKGGALRVKLPGTGVAVCRRSTRTAPGGVAGTKSMPLPIAYVPGGASTHNRNFSG
ncbi:hypothetical protein V1279_007591 [Bradyrhizobium sp. AZCC 1610]|uniref:hypothetical protein n=1 Tax=Bradyrhizobium sp. AZCC 1610 TaxID=3117020 RepID=UPI002FF0861F